MGFEMINIGYLREKLGDIALIATDMDGTLTKNGKFTGNLLVSLEKLARVNIRVLIVTGRSAGWVEGIQYYLPIVGAIAENGGLFYRQNEAIPEFLSPIADLGLHRQQLQEIFRLLKDKFPQIRESADNRFRLTDWTFDVAELTHTELRDIASICNDHGWGFTYSTVQCHIKPLNQDKANGILTVLSRYFPQFTPASVITVGDSPNDESLFNTSIFPLSVGVANLRHYQQYLRYKPTYITTHEEVEGFQELVDLLLS